MFPLPTARRVSFCSGVTRAEMMIRFSESGTWGFGIEAYTPIKQLPRQMFGD